MPTIPMDELQYFLLIFVLLVCNLAFTRSQIMEFVWMILIFLLVLGFISLLYWKTVNNADVRTVDKELSIFADVHPGTSNAKETGQDPVCGPD